MNSKSQNETKKAQVQHYFTRTADMYVQSISHRTGKDLQRLLQLGAWETHQKVLDIATGGGHTALAVAPHVETVLAIDLTEKMLASAEKYILDQGVTNIQFQVADAEQLPFADHSFDRVTCRIAPHHFPDVAQAIQEAYRVLKPRGLCLFIDNLAPAHPELDAFTNEIEKRRDASHIRSHTQQEWQSYFSQAGFLIQYIELFRRTHNYQDWMKRAHVSEEEKKAHEQFILASDPSIQRYFALRTDNEGQHIESISMDYILIKARKN